MLSNTAVVTGQLDGSSAVGDDMMGAGEGGEVTGAAVGATVGMAVIATSIQSAQPCDDWMMGR